MAARLVFLTGGRAGTPVDLDDSFVAIGRNPNCTIVFSPNEVLVSAERATLVHQDGSYVLRDDRSRNRTFVNGKRIGEYCVLRHNDLVQFGAGGTGGRLVIGAGREPLQTLNPDEVARASEERN